MASEVPRKAPNFARTVIVISSGGLSDPDNGVRSRGSGHHEKDKINDMHALAPHSIYFEILFLEVPKAISIRFTSPPTRLSLLWIFISIFRRIGNHSFLTCNEWIGLCL